MSCVAAREVTDVSRVKVEENGRSAIFVNNERAKFHKVKVDGGLIDNQLCADYVVSKDQVGSVVVELKGTDIEHAVDQIDATITIMKTCGSPRSKDKKIFHSCRLQGLLFARSILGQILAFKRSKRNLSQSIRFRFTVSQARVSFLWRRY